VLLRLRADASAVLRIFAAVWLALLPAVAVTLFTAAPASASVRDQWQIDMLGAREAWKISTGAGVTVAVIDSGVAALPDLAGRVQHGIDLVSRNGDGSNDEVGHGTTVAGLIAGHSADGRGVIGLAPDATILPVRVLNAENRYKDAKVVAQGLVWAVDHGARVVNLSLGGGAVSPALADAIDYAFAKDVVVVACVGNVMVDGPTTIWHPASEPGVLAVTALTPDGQVWKGALTGPQTVLAAPGSDLVGSGIGGFERVQGTSFASPLVAASAALVRSHWPTMSAANVVQRLIRTARDVGPTGRDNLYGFGVVDPYAALTAQVPEVLTNPLDTTPPPGRSGFGFAPPPVVSAPASLPPTASPGQQTARISSTRPFRERPVALAAALAGFAVLVGGSLTLIRRL
jgi:type VII secretion-associated serine protease mycosin